MYRFFSALALHALLDLAIAAGAVQSHGGAIEAHNVEGVDLEGPMPRCRCAQGLAKLYAIIRQQDLSLVIAN